MPLAPGFAIISERRHHDTSLRHIVRPEPDPFQRDIAGVFLIFQDLQGVFQRQIAGAGDAVLQLAVPDDAILDMDMLDVVSQVGVGDGWGFAAVADGMVDIPEGGHIGAIHCIQDLLQPGGVRIDAVGFRQQDHIIFFRFVGEPL